MFNQFGQYLQVGDWVGWASKTGSHTTRKIGQITHFGEREVGYNRTETVAYVDWLYDGSYGTVAKAITDKGRSNGVGINRLLKLEPNPNW